MGGCVLEEIPVAGIKDLSTGVEKAKEIATGTLTAREVLFADPTTVEHSGINATRVLTLLMIAARSERVEAAATLAAPMGIVNGEKATATGTALVLKDLFVEATIAGA